MKYLSVCSGIEAATAAWHSFDWKPVAFSEIEKFPSQVLQHHYPTVPNLGDMTKYKEWNIDPIDLLVGGTPCQSFSVAGLRKGLADPRGNLALVYCGILDHFRPRWFVWENVPGVLSSNGGRDFGSFLGALAELGYGFAYRVLDAQFFGVAQRRRRVFVVGHLGDWRPAAEVLFESESLRGDPAPRREKGKNVAPTVTGGPPFSRTGNDRVETDAVVVGALGARTGLSRGVQDAQVGHMIMQPMAFAQNTRDEVRFINGDGAIVGALSAEAGMKQQNYIAQPISIHPHCIGRDANSGPQEKEYLNDGSAYCLDGRGQPQAVAFGGDIARTLSARHDSSPCADRGQDVIANGMAVRRLTPIECERLQGFPDNYTNIPKAADGPRYKALGNSMAVPVMRWIGKRINEYKGK